jgi:transglutaminase-like putative cysteine protease
MKLLWRVRISVLLVVLLALLSYGSSEHDPALGAAVMIAAIAGWWFTEFRVDRGLPRWFTNLLLIGLVLGAAYRVFSGAVLVSAFTGFLAVLLVIKMWERRRPMDYGQLLTMSLFLLVGATLTDNTLGVGLSLIIFLPVFVWAVLLYQLFAPAFRAIPNSERVWSEGEPAIRPYTSTMTIARGGWCRLVSVGVVAVVGASAVAVCVFIFVPRGIGLGRMGEFGRAVTGRTTGFNDRVQLGQGGLISQSQERILELQVNDNRSPAAKAATPVRYLRGAVLEEYNQGLWTKVDASNRRVTRRHIVMGQLEKFVDPPDHSKAIHQDIKLLSAPSGDTPLFALYKPHSVLVSDVAGSLTYDWQSAVITRRGAAGRIEYTVTSVTDEETSLRNEESQESVNATRLAAYRRRRLNVSFPSERIRELAASVLSERGIEADPSLRPIDQDLIAARTLRTHLEHRATYTLDILAAPPGTDPTEWFCFEAKRGHCEYFASALAAMCRSVGIDARVVTGYATGEIEPPAPDAPQFGSFGRDTYIVRASNAHAWVEARVAPDRWITLDATPPGELTRIASPTATLNGRFWRWLDGVENIWATHVVSFDNKQQTELFGRGVRLPWLERSVDWMRRQTMGEPGGKRFQIDLQRLLTGLSLVVLGGVIVHLALRRRRLNKDVAIALTPLDPAARRVRESLLDSLSKRGYPKPSHAPLLTHTRAIADPALASDATRIASRLYDAVFGGQALTAPEAREFVALARELSRGR